MTSKFFRYTNPIVSTVTGLIAARSVPGRRYALRNNELVIHNLDGATEKRVITDVSELEKIISEVFGLTLPETAGLRDALKKVL